MAWSGWNSGQACSVAKPIGWVSSGVWTSSRPAAVKLPPGSRTDLVPGQELENVLKCSSLSEVLTADGIAKLARSRTQSRSQIAIHHRQQQQQHFIRTQRGDDPVGGETLTSLSECSIMASSLDSDGPSSMTLQVVSKHCTCVVPLLRAANYARSLV